MKIGAIFLLIGVALAAFFLFSGHEGDGGNPESSATTVPEETGLPATSPTPVMRKASAFTVRITENGLVPKDLSVFVGDSVVFVNETGFRRWPASDPHPVHTLCPGFDSHGIAPGAEYSFTFQAARTCSFHDHLSPGDGGLRGVITVQ